MSDSSSSTELIVKPCMETWSGAGWHVQFIFVGKFKFPLVLLLLRHAGVQPDVVEHVSDSLSSPLSLVSSKECTGTVALPGPVSVSRVNRRRLVVNDVKCSESESSSLPASTSVPLSSSAAVPLPSATLPPPLPLAMEAPTKHSTPEVVSPNNLRLLSINRVASALAVKLGPSVSHGDWVTLRCRLEAFAGAGFEHVAVRSCTTINTTGDVSGIALDAVAWYDGSEGEIGRLGDDAAAMAWRYVMPYRGLKLCGCNLPMCR